MIDAKLTTMEMEKLTRTKPYFALVRPRSYLPCGLDDETAVPDGTLVAFGLSVYLPSVSTSALPL